MTGPTDREFGELIGEVRGMRKELADLQRTNSEEHRQNGERFNRLEGRVQEALDSKADKKIIEDQAKALDSLRQDQSKRLGRDSFAKSAFGALVGGLGVFFAGGGHL
jgi:hypothetical protein